ncbi:MAG: hypothetical protein ACW9W3_00985 [Candidatus Nitrosopumilus sp. bin_68KS]
MVLVTTIFVIVNFGIECQEIPDGSQRCFFNEQKWENNDFFNVIATILTASGAILAISFFITQMVISNIGQNYSINALDSYLKKKHPHYVFSAWIIIVAFSSLSLFVLNFVPIYTSFIISLVIINGFSISLILFVRQYHDMMKLVNPYDFMDDIMETVFEHIRNVEEHG